MAKKKTKREQLLEAGIEVFVEKGFEKATIDEIVIRAGCGKGTFYRYFSQKEALFEALDENFLKSMSEALKKNLKDSLNPKEYLHVGLETFIKVFTQNNKVGLIRFERDFRLNSEERHQSSRKILKNFFYMKDYLDKAIEQGKIRKTNSEAILITLIGTAHFFLFRDFKLGLPHTPQEIKDTIDVLYYGVKPA